jgi:hypothetical protein
MEGAATAAPTTGGNDDLTNRGTLDRPAPGRRAGADEPPQASPARLLPRPQALGGGAVGIVPVALALPAAAIDMGLVACEVALISEPRQ